MVDASAKAPYSRRNTTTERTPRNAIRENCPINAHTDRSGSSHPYGADSKPALSSRQRAYGCANIQAFPVSYAARRSAARVAIQMNQEKLEELQAETYELCVEFGTWQ